MYIDTYMYIHFLLENAISLTMGRPEGGGNLKWGWHRRGQVPQCPGMEDVLRLPEVPSWSRLLWAGAERSARAAPSPLSCQLQAGSSQRDQMPVRGTEDSLLCRLPGATSRANQGGCSWQLELVNCLWVAPALALPRCE